METLLTEAGQRADSAVSLHEFTHRLNRELPANEKLGIVEMLWQVSHADGRIDKHEEQLIQRIAGLLHISGSGPRAVEVESRGRRRRGRLKGERRGGTEGASRTERALISMACR